MVKDFFYKNIFKNIFHSYLWCIGLTNKQWIIQSYRNTNYGPNDKVIYDLLFSVFSHTFTKYGHCGLSQIGRGPVTVNTSYLGQVQREYLKINAPTWSQSTKFSCYWITYEILLNFMLKWFQTNFIYGNIFTKLEVKLEVIKLFRKTL